MSSQGVVLAIAASAMVWVLATRTSAPDASKPFSVPALPQIAAPCSEAAEHAQHRAKQALRAAIARAERYTFEPQDGLIALERFEEAASCAALANDTTLAQDSARRSSRFRARLEHDYLEHITRYRLARQIDRLDEAGEDVDFLVALLAQHSPTGMQQLRLDQLELERRASARSKP